MQKRFTIEDVAKRAGVGKVTVSYVLNGRAAEARISKETCERVQLAAQELDYRPNAVAKSMVSKRADAISVVFQKGDFFSAGSMFVSELMRGVCEACITADINLILHTRTFTDPVAEAHALMDGRTDGVLILRDQGDPLVDHLAKRKFPMVMFFTRPSDQSIDFIDADNFAGGRLATQHLLDKGHRSIAFAAGSKFSVASNDRLAGYRSALENSGISPDPKLQMELTTPEEVGDSFVNWIKTSQATALVCWSDDVAFAGMKALKAAGFNLPKDLSIIGFDSLEACERVSPRLTSVRQPVYEIGKTAARNLIQQMRGIATASTPSIYPLSLDERDSVLPFLDESSTKRHYETISNP